MIHLLLYLLFSLVTSQNTCDYEYFDPVSSKTYKFNYAKLTRSTVSNYYTGWETPDRGYTYVLNPCGVVQNVTQCQAANATLCQVNDVGAWVATVASWTKDPAMIWSIIDPSNPAQGAQQKFTNGDTCYIFGQPRARTAFLQFVCGSLNSSAPTNFAVTEDDSTCTFITTMVSPNACSGGGGGGGGGGSSDDLSGGSIFIIMLVCVVPVYILVGCIYKWRVNGTSGIESCPNIEFWRDLPHLVKDGFSYTMSGCKKGSDSHYDEL